MKYEGDTTEQVYRSIQERKAWQRAMSTMRGAAIEKARRTGRRKRAKHGGAR